MARTVEAEQQILFKDEDFAKYQHLMASSCAGCGTQARVYRLMPNQAHLIMALGEEDSLRCTTKDIRLSVAVDTD